MADIVAVLNAHEAMRPVWISVVWVCAAYVGVLGLTCLMRPELAARFLDGHASSPHLNRVEAAARLIAGLGFMGASPDMRFGDVFFWAGAVLAATAVPMLFLYGLHRQYAGWAVPMAKRALPLLGIGALAICAVIVWALVR